MSETDEVPLAESALEARLADVSTDAAALRVLLPAELQPLISDAVVRSHKLYEEFVDRLVLRVARETGLEAATREPASPAEVVARLGLEARRALAPVDWILRRLAARRTVEESGTARRFRSCGAWPAGSFWKSAAGWGAAPWPCSSVWKPPDGSGTSERTGSRSSCRRFSGAGSRPSRVARGVPAGSGATPST